MGHWWSPPGPQRPTWNDPVGLCWIPMPQVLEHLQMKLTKDYMVQQAVTGLTRVRPPRARQAWTYCPPKKNQDINTAESCGFTRMLTKFWWPIPLLARGRFKVGCIKTLWVKQNKKRQIHYFWGPTANHEFIQVDNLEGERTRDM